MARIYTRSGDKGETALIGGVRVAKSDPRVALYGTVDELNSLLGEVISRLQIPVRDNILMETRAAHLRGEFQALQSRLFDLGALLADPQRCRECVESAAPIPALDAAVLEVAIDRMEEDLPTLKQFILPGGVPAGSACHLARATCRRTERLAVSLNETIDIPAAVITYLNRLADYLFVAARWINTAAGEVEINWVGQDGGDV